MPPNAPNRLPSRVMLPSGIIVRLSHDAADRLACPTATLSNLVQTLHLLEAPGVVRTDDHRPLDVRSLSVRDAHVLRAFLGYAGIFYEDDVERTCENCDKPFRVKPTSLFEVGPFVDLELSDPDLDAPFNHDEAHAIPRVLVGKERARTIRIAPRTVDEVLALWYAARPKSFRFTPAIIVTMGITALGRERRARVIAEALMNASPDAQRAIADLVYRAHYSPRLMGAYKCTACGARNDVEVLPVREIPYDARESRRRRKQRLFPDIDTFEKLVREAGKRIYRHRGVRNIPLIVDDGVPACDDGGEPLLGCYTPGNPDDVHDGPRGPEIRIFYRTFQAVHRDEPSFDVRAEIDETIDHEVTHHLHFLAGDDPLDDEEREAIVEENIRRVGKREAARRASKLFVDDIAGFFRTAWPLLLIAFVATWLGFFRCQ